MPLFYVFSINCNPQNLFLAGADAKLRSALKKMHRCWTDGKDDEL